MKRPVRIVDYSPQWPRLYEEEKRLILEAVGHKIIDIEHIGSTAVPGLGGKPIIDIVATVHQSIDADECIQLLNDLDYRDVTLQPENSDWYYCLSKTYLGKAESLKNYHLHLVRFRSNHWKKHLLFRDFLRSHHDIAQQYFELKKRMAIRFGSDREEYTGAKTSFIESIVAKAETERKTY